jgi:hypothetical protein
VLGSFHLKFWCSVATGLGILTEFVSTCPVMAACNPMVQKQVYEYLILLKYCYLNVGATRNLRQNVSFRHFDANVFCTAGCAIVVAM